MNQLPICNVEVVEMDSFMDLYIVIISYFICITIVIVLIVYRL